nr:putative mating-type 1-2-1 protein [Ceratocystis harringtonii]
MNSSMPNSPSIYPNFDVNSAAETIQSLDMSNLTNMTYSQLGDTSQPSHKISDYADSLPQFEMESVLQSNANFDMQSVSQPDTNVNIDINSIPQPNFNETNDSSLFGPGAEMNTIPQADAGILIDTNYMPQLEPFEINTASQLSPNACVSAVFQHGSHADIDMSLVPQLNHFEMNIIPPFDTQAGINTLPPHLDPFSEMNAVTQANNHANLSMSYVPQLNSFEVDNTPLFDPNTDLNSILQTDPQTNVNMNCMPSLNHFEMGIIAQPGPTTEMDTAASFQPTLDMRAVSGSTLNVDSDKESDINANSEDSSDAKSQGAILRKIFKMAFQQFSSSAAKIAIIDANLVLSLKPKSKRFLLDSTSLTIGTPAHLVRDLQQPHRFLIGDKVLFNTQQKTAVAISGCEDLLWIDVIPRSLIKPAPPAPKKKVEYRVPRPPNAYILYRKDRHRDAKFFNPHMDNNDISRLLGEHWRCESLAIREHYQKTAADYKEMFMLTYPDYQYRPRKANQRKRRARRAVASAH